MKWSLKEPQCGDMIRVKSGSVYHYGVFVSDGEVIQFGKAPNRRLNVKDSEIEVETTDIYDFLSGGFLEVAELDKKEKNQRRTPDDTVAYARSRIGEKGYNILYNNCEHFAYESVLGVKYCSQTENVRALFRNLPIVDVYFAELPEEEPNLPLASGERQAEVEATAHSVLKRQRYYVWRLLEYALNRSFGIKPETVSFTKNANGKWEAPCCCFSLSHGERMLAVAVSRKAVGVDIEKIVEPRAKAFAQKMLSAEEYADYLQQEPSVQTDFLIRKWTAKESLFKMQGGETFRPCEFATEKNVHTDVITVDGERYAFSVASENVERLRVYNNIQL